MRQQLQTSRVGWVVWAACAVLSVGCGRESLDDNASSNTDEPGATGGGLQIKAIEGSGQTGLIGQPVNVPPAVRVTLMDGNPLAGTSVVFSVATGGGKLAESVVKTDADGIARVSEWVLGGAAGKNVITASVMGDAGATTATTATTTALPSINLEATASTSSFDIELHFANEPDERQRAAFDAAAATWESLIFGDLEDRRVNQKCGTVQINRDVDDLLIVVELKAIDGPGGVLGRAGPCSVRGGSHLPFIGVMTFDTADLAALDRAGVLSNTIIHEMGHVLGFGTLWDLKTLLADPAADGGTDPHFTGEHAIAAFDRLTEGGFNEGEKVPVENQGKAGTIDGHWRESIFDKEIMTGYLDNGNSHPLSATTAASLWDLGYQVNMAAADSFSLSEDRGGFALRAHDHVTVELGQDIADEPLFIDNESGELFQIR